MGPALPDVLSPGRSVVDVEDATGSKTLLMHVIEYMDYFHSSTLRKTGVWKSDVIADHTGYSPKRRLLPCIGRCKFRCPDAESSPSSP